MLFFRVNRDFLTEKRVKWYMIIDLITGAVALGLAVELVQTKWTLLFAVVSIVCLVDSCLIRYAYEIKRTIKGA